MIVYTKWDIEKSYKGVLKEILLWGLFFIGDVVVMNIVIRNATTNDAEKVAKLK